MPSKKTTTVVFTKPAQKIKDRLSPAFGLKGLLSAALQLFDELDDSEKIARTAEAKKQEDAYIDPHVGTKKPVTLRQVLRNIVEKTKADQPFEGDIIKLDASDKSMLEELIKLIGPEQKQQIKKRKRG